MPDKIYTRRGDDGTTQLLYGGPERVPKDAARPTAYGDADEAVSALGMARAEASADGQDDVAGILLRLQRDLFVVNAELATAAEDWERLSDGVSRVTPDMVQRLEGAIDDLEGRFEQPKDFIVPGNTRLGATLDHAGRVIRRAERSIVSLAHSEGVRPEVMRYVNRLSDLVWMLARYAERAERQPRPRG